MEKKRNFKSKDRFEILRGAYRGVSKESRIQKVALVFLGKTLLVVLALILSGCMVVMGDLVIEKKCPKVECPKDTTDVWDYYGGGY